MRNVSKNYYLYYSVVARLDGKNVSEEFDKAVFGLEQVVTKHITLGRLPHDCKCSATITITPGQAVQLDELCKLYDCNASKMLNILFENYYYWAEEKIRRNGGVLPEVADLGNKICTLNISVEKCFAELWNKYLNESGKKSCNIVSEIFENVEKYVGKLYKPEGDKERVGLGISVKIKDKQKITKMLENKSLVKDMLYAYMEANK